MKRVLRFPISITDRQILTVPSSLQVTSVALSRISPRQIDLWGIVNDEITAHVSFNVWVVGTGNPMPEEVSLYDFVGTVVDRDNNLVWHVFAIKGTVN